MEDDNKGGAWNTFTYFLYILDHRIILDPSSVRRVKDVCASHWSATADVAKGFILPNWARF